MRLLGITVFVGAIVVGVSAQQPSPPFAQAVQAPSTMPKLLAPPDAKLASSHGDRGPDAFGGLTGHAAYRLQTTMSASAIADHYVPQLVATGWKPTLSPKPSSMAIVRFSAGSTDDPLIGILTVVPFAQQQSALVMVDLIRARPPTPMSGRLGGAAGGGAGTPAEIPILLPDASVSEIPFPESVRLPQPANRVEQLVRGGSPDSSHTETRLETFASPAELMKIMESQIMPRGWIVDVRAGDPLQAVTKFNPLWVGDSTALLLVTSLRPGEVSIMLNVYRNRGLGPDGKR
jgi:hypothetical protein